MTPVSHFGLALLLVPNWAPLPSLPHQLIPLHRDADWLRAKHRLTIENVCHMFAVDRELFPLMKPVPDLERRADELARRTDPPRRLGVVAVNAKVYEAIPEIAEILRRHGISGRKYTLTHLVAMVTAMADDTLTHEALRHGVIILTRVTGPKL